MPGTDPAEAVRIVAGELPDFPYLPARGRGADLIGRTAGLTFAICVAPSCAGRLA